MGAKRNGESEKGQRLSTPHRDARPLSARASAAVTAVQAAGRGCGKAEKTGRVSRSCPGTGRTLGFP